MEFMYTTEYQRSFLAGINQRSPSKEQANKFITPRSPPRRGSTEKCSIGIQTNADHKRVHFKRYSDRSPINQTPLESTPPKTFERHNVKPKIAFSEEASNINKEKRVKPHVYEERSPPIQNDAQTNFCEAYTPTGCAFDFRAGSHSEDYQRAPFISKKKKVQDNPFLSNPSLYRVSSEPCLQKKRISMYPKNHNILRTFTVKEEEESPRSSPNKFKSSYSLHFDEKPQEQGSAIMSALYTMNRKNSSSSVHSALFSELEDSHRFHKKDYDKGNYETEYQNIFARKNSSQNKLVSPLLEAVKDNQEFTDYYKQVLNKRIYAYSPSMRESSVNTSNDSYSPPNEKHFFDEKQSEKFMDDDISPTTTQRYSKGRYTRDYQPDLYSPRHD
eukprot:TCONS_00064946-protein